MSFLIITNFFINILKSVIIYEIQSKISPIDEKLSVHISLNVYVLTFTNLKIVMNSKS